jgi:hypothetical protein
MKRKAYRLYRYVFLAMETVYLTFEVWLTPRSNREKLQRILWRIDRMEREINTYD